jgi:predicted tellurium resistance membrane protein TerC
MLDLFDPEFLRALVLPASMQELQDKAPLLMAILLIELLFSVDNLFNIDDLAEHLGEEDRQKAYTIGVITAYAARVTALVGILWINAFAPWAMAIPALYLIYSMAENLAHDDPPTAVSQSGTFKQTVVAMTVINVWMSFESVVNAVAMQDRAERKYWLLIWAVIIGSFVLRLLSDFTQAILKRFPNLFETISSITGFLGFMLLYETSSPYLRAAAKSLEIKGSVTPSFVESVHAWTEPLSVNFKLTCLLGILGIAVVHATIPASRYLFNPLLKYIAMPLVEALWAVIKAIVKPFRKDWQ